MASWLGLDLATSSGAAFWRPGMPYPRAWALQLPQGAEIGIWLDALEVWLAGFMKLEQITEVGVETPLIGMGDQTKNFKLISAAGIVQMIGARMTRESGTKVTVQFISNQTMVSHWVGSNEFHGKDRKTRSVLAAHARGFGKVQSHDVADALGVLTRLLWERRVAGVPWDIQKGTVNTLFEKKPDGVRIDKSNHQASARTLNSALSFDREREKS